MRMHTFQFLGHFTLHIIVCVTCAAKPNDEFVIDFVFEKDIAFTKPS